MSEDQVAKRFCVAMTTCEAPEEANALASALLEAGLAACVQMCPITSVYRWEGNIEQSAEISISIKTTEAKISEIERFLERNHSYEVPELVVLPIVAGGGSYLSWIAANLTE